MKEETIDMELVLKFREVMSPTAIRVMTVLEGHPKGLNIKSIHKAVSRIGGPPKKDWAIVSFHVLNLGAHGIIEDRGYHYLKKPKDGKPGRIAKRYGLSPLGERFLNAVRQWFRPVKEE